MVKNPYSNIGNMGLIPGLETKIPYATGKLSLFTTTERMQSGAHMP